MPQELTFSQRYGYEPLPEPMRLEHLSDNLRREIWNEFYDMASTDGYDVSWSLVQDFCMEILDRLKDKVRLPDEYIEHDAVMYELQEVVLKGEFNKVFDFCESVMNHENESMLENINSFAGGVMGLLDEYQAAYRLDMLEQRYQIVPRASKEAGEATQEAVETVCKGGMAGASQYLRDSVTHINDKQYADSIMDSISAVESVARKITGESTLGKAIKPLEKSGLINAHFATILKQMWGYACDFRHGQPDSNSDNAPDVGMDEALFMYGACASFAAYLTNKHRQQQGGSH